MKGYIYKYTFSDGKVYIGQTRRHPDERHREHFDNEIGKLNPKFWNAYQNLGMPDFEIVEIIEKDRVQELVPVLNEKETAYIQLYKSANPEFGYNIRDHAFVAVPKDKVLDAEFERLWLLCAEEWYPVFESVKNKCFETYEPLTKEEMEFCEKEFSDEENIFADTLKEFHFDFVNLKNNSENAKFWFGECAEFAEERFCEASWEIIRQHIEHNKEQILKEHLPETTIVQMDTNGKIIREYASSADVKEAFKLKDMRNIYNVLEGRQKHAYGYIWRYKKDMNVSKSQDKDGQLNISFDS